MDMYMDWNEKEWTLMIGGVNMSKRFAFKLVGLH
jgi:hypothetical protein